MKLKVTDCVIKALKGIIECKGRSLDIKDELKAKVEECNWNPDFMKVRALQWIDGLSWDWCISRQRYFGVPFPIWYSKRAGEEGKVIIATADELPVSFCSSR